jgi:hypothetical protein
MALRRHDDLLGAHVSTQGGVAAAPARGAAIGATAMQLFTKTPNQWREPALTTAHLDAYRAALARSGVQVVVSHDSYLINLASPDETLRARLASPGWCRIRETFSTTATRAWLATRGSTPPVWPPCRATSAC